MAKHYICDKENNQIIQGSLGFDKLKGFNIKPQNKIKYEGVEVGHLTLLEPSLIEKVLKRKTQRQLNAYLNYIISTLDSTDTDSGDLVLILDDVKEYKNLIINKYAPFLDPKYIKKILLKVKFIEDELKNKIYDNNFYMMMSQSKGRGR